MTQASPGVRPVAPGDLDVLVALCVEHAEYERASLALRPDASQLGRALFGESPRLFGWLARMGDEPAGYATASSEFSTWTSSEYLHVDCLYVRAHARNRGIGRLLLDAIAAHARRSGIVEMQWQTPDWNTGAIRFYCRYGAIGIAKQRFVLSLR